MKSLFLFVLLPIGTIAWQTPDLHQLRRLYQRAALIERDAAQLDSSLLAVDSSAAPLLICYKGANEMIKARYALNPITKLKRFNIGKAWLKNAFNRDTSNLEMRFIRFSIQSNLPYFLDYHNNLDQDRQYLLDNTNASKDAELREMIFNYLGSLTTIRPEQLKQLTN